MNANELGEHAERVNRLRQLKTVYESLSRHGREEALEIRQELRALERELYETTEHVLAFVEQIEDTPTRIMFRLHYVHGLSWTETAKETGTTREGARSACRRYMQTHQTPPDHNKHI